MARTSPKPNPPTCRESASGQADSRVRTFLYLAGNEGLQASEALSFLKSLDSSKARLPKIDPNGLSLKMLKICSPLIEDGTLRPFSIRWPKSAIISNTDCLIHASTAFRKTGNASTLSLIDILEPRVDEKYSFQSHDPSQRSNGFLTLAGGIVITFAKEILNLITG